MENIIANVAQFDNDVRTERSVAGMKGAIREGRYVWPAPFGYVNVRVDGRATIAPGEKSDVVKRLFEEVAKGTESVNIIRLKLQCEGLVTAKGGPIEKSMVYRMLHNPVYCGWIAKFGERHQGTYTPIISEVLFDRVQSVLHTKRPKKPYSTKHPDFPLRRFMTHTNGEVLTGGWSKGKRNYYGYYYFRTAHTLFRKEILEQWFVKLLNALAFTEQQCAFLKQEILSFYKDRINHQNNFQKTTDEKETALKRKRDMIIEKNIAGILSDSVTKEKLIDIENELWKITSSKGKTPAMQTVHRKFLQTLEVFLKKPGTYWATQKLETQLKLQVFNFPKGIVFENTNCRTPEMCCIYKEKSRFWRNLSLLVTHYTPNQKHSKSLENPHLKVEEYKVLLEDITDDLVTLEEILTEKEAHQRLHY